jgi:hypothetical protein
MKVKLELVIEEDAFSVRESVEKIVDRAKEITTVVSAKSDDLYYQA